MKMILFIALAMLFRGAALSEDAGSIFHSIPSSEVMSIQGDEYLGMVNLCDSDGVQCLLGKAYRDSETDRIYVYVQKTGSTTVRHYAQKSNKSYWTYMIRFENNWLYFSF